MDPPWSGQTQKVHRQFGKEMKYFNPEIGDQLAAEYVLGTMPVLTRQRFEALLKINPQLRRVVAIWEARLTPMASSVAELAPPQAVWRAIQKRLFGNLTRDQERQSNWWSNIGFWPTTDRSAISF